MTERWGHACIEGAIIRALAEAVRYVCGDNGDREHEAESLRVAVMQAKTEHDEMRAALAAALARAEQLHGERDQMMAQIRDMQRERGELRARVEQLQADPDLARAELVAAKADWVRSKRRADHAERTATEAQRRLEEVREVVVAARAWADDSDPFTNWDGLDVLEAAVKAMPSAAIAWAEGHAEPAAPALDVADVMPLVVAVSAMLDCDDLVVQPGWMWEVSDAFDALPPAWREAAAARKS